MSLLGVRSKMTVTYLSPLWVQCHMCLSTPITRTPSNRAESAIKVWWPSVRTAVLVVFHHTGGASAIRVTVR